MRRFLLLCQALYVTKEANSSTDGIILPKWELKADEVFRKYFVDRAPLDSDFRSGLVELLKLGVPPDTLLEWFFAHVIRLEPKNLKFMSFVAGHACEFECRLRNAQIGLIHLEAFLCIILHALSIKK